MKKYFYLQIKRILKVFPFILSVTLVLFLSIMIILSSVITNFENKEENQKFYIGITGDTDSEYIKWGISAFESFDETRFSIELVDMTQDKAQKALSRGEISAYVILPDNFVSNALSGKIEPVTYVTSAGATGIVTMFKNEVTKMITDVLLYSQKGTYGIGDALSDNGHSKLSGKYVNEISIEYVDLILSRNDIYTFTELGISDGLSTTDYFVCSLCIVLIMLVGLPYVTIFVKKDRSLDKLLVSKGYSSTKLIVCEYLSHALSMVAIMFTLLIVIMLFVGVMPNAVSSYFSFSSLLRFALYLLPIIFMLSAFNIMIFEASDNIVNCVLIHFFASLCLCYISGCLYPIYTFPVSVQKLALVLPTGLSRIFLSGAFTHSFPLLQFAGIILYAVVFFFVAVAVRTQKTAAKGR